MGLFPPANTKYIQYGTTYSHQPLKPWLTGSCLVGIMADVAWRRDWDWDWEPVELCNSWTCWPCP